jgi:hypothetical protein
MAFYRTIISQAWKSTWHNKYLWFFGLFAALLGNGGELEIIFRGFDDNLSEGLFPSLWGLAQTGIFSKTALVNITHLAMKEPFTVFVTLGVLFVLFILGIFLVWLAIVSQVGLVNNAARITTGKRHDIKDGIEAGIKRFWPIFGLNAMLKIVIYLFFALISIPVISSATKAYFSANSFLFIIAFLIFIPVAITLSFIVKYAICYSVIQGEAFIKSIKMGWNLFARNWIISLEMAFLLFFINFIVGVCLVVFFLVMAVPFLFVLIVFTKLALYINFWFVVVSALIILIVVVAFVGSILASFQISSWTGLFIELVGRGGMSKIVRVFGRSK